MKSYMQKKETVERNWYVIDATDIALGRLATKAASMLRGKHKATYTPHIDCGDYIIITNASKVKLTGDKLNKKLYYNHSGYTGGLRTRTAKEMISKYPVDDQAGRAVSLRIRGRGGPPERRQIHVDQRVDRQADRHRILSPGNHP